MNLPKWKMWNREIFKTFKAIDSIENSENNIKSGFKICGIASLVVLTE